VESFTPLSSLAGGALIGLAASVLLLIHGRVAGISGVLGETLRGKGLRGEGAFRGAFLAGLFLAGLGLRLVYPAAFPAAPAGASASSQALLFGITAAAGLFVGYGTRLGSGCTSGHGVCGLSRFSKRSLAATLTFMTAGAATVFVVRHVLGVAL
jgi:uncharacterized membrane protein YedE/YeeE